MVLYWKLLILYWRCGERKNGLQKANLWCEDVGLQSGAIRGAEVEEFLGKNSIVCHIDVS